MMMKSFTAGIVGSALLATAAFAQSPAATTTTPAATTTTVAATNSSYTGNWRTSKVVGLNVYNEANESLGSINDLLTDKDGKIVAVVIGVGGFLGVGERYVAIPFEKVKFVNEPVKTNTAMNAAPGGTMTKSTSSTTTTGAAGSGMTTPATTSTATTPTAATATGATPNPWYPDHAVISGTKDELKALPQFKYDNS